MSQMPAALEAQLKQAYGVTEKPPLVRFVDWALKDELASKRSGRPRYRDTPFIEMRPQDGSRDVYREEVTEEHKIQYAREWNAYLESKRALDIGSPKIGLIPGMTRAKFEELTELGIIACADLVAYEGNLDELEGMRILAKRIMEACNAENREVREERQEVAKSVVGPVHGMAGGLWAGGATSGYVTSPGATQAPKKENQQEEIFRYNFAV